MRLGEIFEITSSRRVHQSEWKNKGIPFYRAREIVSLKKGEKLKDPIFISPETYDAYTKISGKPEIGDLLVTGVGTLGQTFLVKNDDSFYFKDGNVVWFKNFAKIYMNYILFFMDSPFFFETIHSNSQGTTVGTFTIINAKNQLMPLPPINEQHRIVQKIEELLPLVEQYDKAERKLTALNTNFPEQLKKSVLQAAIQGKLTEQDPNDEPAFALIERIKAEKNRLIAEKKLKKPKSISEIVMRDNLPYEIKDGVERCIADEVPFEIPENWCWVRLGEIGDWGSGATPSRHNSDYYNGDIPWLKTGDLNDGEISIIPEFITYKALQECSVRLNPIGSVLIAMYGATIGKLGILKIEATTNQACCACIPFNGVYNKFLFYYLMSQKSEFQKKSEGSGQPNISKEKIINYLFPLPPIKEQYRIVQKIETLFSKIDHL